MRSYLLEKRHGNDGKAGFDALPWRFSGPPLQGWRPWGPTLRHVKAPRPARCGSKAPTHPAHGTHPRPQRSNKSFKPTPLRHIMLSSHLQPCPLADTACGAA